MNNENEFDKMIPENIDNEISADSFEVKNFSHMEDIPDENVQSVIPDDTSKTEQEPSEIVYDTSGTDSGYPRVQRQLRGNGKDP